MRSKANIPFLNGKIRLLNHVRSKRVSITTFIGPNTVVDFSFNKTNLCKMYF